MRKRLASWLRRLADWLDPTPLASSELLPIVRKLMEEADKLEASGLYKHRYVLALLLKQYPGTRERDWNYLIEAIIQGRV